MAVAAQRHGVRVVAFQKCGHTSIINSFKTPCGEDVVRGADGLDDMFAGVATNDWPHPVATIAYLRHPLSRLVSVYNHLVLGTYRENFDQFGMYAGMPFAIFCDRLCDHSTDVDLDPHTKRQAVSLVEMSDDTTLWLARLEEINQRWPAMVDTFGLACVREPAHFNNKARVPWPLMYHRHSKADLNNLLNVYSVDMDLWETHNVAE